MSDTPDARDGHPLPPRLIEWTGERCVPWVNGPQLVYEHYHRYLFASRFVSGKRVLDLASGEGYGVDLLAATAADVVGIDIDEASSQHARLHHSRSNARFAVGSMLELERHFAAGSFDVVTCFEAIEHVVDHDRVLEGVAHVLSGEGMFFVSTPDREPYKVALADGTNPYHVHELDPAELFALLHSRFDHVRIWEQRYITGSIAVPVDGISEGALEFAFQRRGSGWEAVDVQPATYQLAVAARRSSDLPSAMSWLDDYGRELAHVPAAPPNLGVCWTDDPRLAQERLAALDIAYGRLAEETAALAAAAQQAITELGEARDQLLASNQEVAALRREHAAITGSRGWRSVLLARRAADAVRRATARG